MDLQGCLINSLSLSFSFSLYFSFSVYLTLSLHFSLFFFIILLRSISFTHFTLFLFLSLFLTLWNATKTSLRGHHSLLSSSPSKKTPNNPPPPKKGSSDENELDVEEKWLEEFFLFFEKKISLDFYLSSGWRNFDLTRKLAKILKKEKKNKIQGGNLKPICEETKLALNRQWWWQKW